MTCSYSCNERIEIFLDRLWAWPTDFRIDKETETLKSFLIVLLQSRSDCPTKCQAILQVNTEKNRGKSLLTVEGDDGDISEDV